MMIWLSTNFLVNSLQSRPRWPEMNSYTLTLIHTTFQAFMGLSTEIVWFFFLFSSVLAHKFYGDCLWINCLQNLNKIIRTDPKKNSYRLFLIHVIFSSTKGHLTRIGNFFYFSVWRPWIFGDMTSFVFVKSLYNHLWWPGKEFL